MEFQPETSALEASKEHDQEGFAANAIEDLGIDEDDRLLLRCSEYQPDIYI